MLPEPLLERLRIAIIADPFLPVPPVAYGGIERIIDYLVSGLVRRGHQVVLFAAPGSRVPCELIEYESGPWRDSHSGVRHVSALWTHLTRRRHEFDVIHNFGRLAGLVPVLPRAVAKLQTYQRAVTPRSIRWARRLARPGSLEFTACSASCHAVVRHLAAWRTVHNGVRLDDYAFRSRVDDNAPLVFLGRLERIKGAHTAIAVARATGRRLVLAGNIVEHAEHERYFRREIAPHVDGRQITYVGPVTDSQKSELLGRALALLMPIEWEEPFGIVMAEALACGTPVIAFRRGAVSEVVLDGRTGFICETADEMADAVQRAHRLSRSDCRLDAEARFSADVITEGYLAAYRATLARIQA